MSTQCFLQVRGKIFIPCFYRLLSWLARLCTVGWHTSNWWFDLIFGAAECLKELSISDPIPKWESFSTALTHSPPDEMFTYKNLRLYEFRILPQKNICGFCEHQIWNIYVTYNYSTPNFCSRLTIAENNHLRYAW